MDIDFWRFPSSFLRFPGTAHQSQKCFKICLDHLAPQDHLSFQCSILLNVVEEAISYAP